MILKFYLKDSFLCGLRLLVLLVLGLSFSSVDTDFLVVLLEGGKIFSGLRELSFLHTLTDVPLVEGSLDLHKIKLVI